MHIVLVEPEIPPNTGNIARTCAATGVDLHLVHPLGFSLDDRYVKRAGLDYWPLVRLHEHESLDSFLKLYSNSRMFFATTKAKHHYNHVQYRDTDFILFGKETKGLPRELLAQYPDNCIRIPMLQNEAARSLNLSNSVCIILFEALRQLGFPHLV